eukprot:gene11292-biopygen12396
MRRHRRFFWLVLAAAGRRRPNRSEDQCVTCLHPMGEGGGGGSTPRPFFSKINTSGWRKRDPQGEQDTGAGVARAIRNFWLGVARAWRGHVLFPQ